MENSDAQQINLDKLLDSFMGERAIVANILQAFVSSFSDFEKVYFDAKEANDLEAMIRHAHSLKGSAANIRAETMAAKAAELQYALEGDHDESLVREKLDAVLESLPRLIQYIESFES